MRWQGEVEVKSPINLAISRLKADLTVENLKVPKYSMRKNK